MPRHSTVLLKAGAFVAFLAIGANAFAALSTAQVKRIEEAAQVLTEIHTVPDKDIPQDLWDRAACVIVVPSVKKAALMVGGEYGKGLMSCRHNNVWGAPVFMEVGKGSWGLQLGAQSIDLVLLVMNEAGAQKLLKNKVSLGAEASVAGGPVGRDARDRCTIEGGNSVLLAHARIVCRHQPVRRRGAAGCRRQRRSVRRGCGPRKSGR
jgi:lipid-binding SYLF domain-containing protein